LKGKVEGKRERRKKTKKRKKKKKSEVQKEGKEPLGARNVLKAIFQ